MDKEECMSCEELERIAGVINDTLEREGIKCGQALIVIELNGCRKSLFPDCNMGLIKFTLVKILDRLVKSVFEKREVRLGMDPLEVKRQVSEYLKGMGKEKKDD